MVDGEDWSRSECMLALWAYSTLDRNKDIVKADVYREVARLTGRKVSSVRIKLNNISECDPRPRAERPVPPWERRQNLLAELYAEYGTNHTLLDEFHRQYSYAHDFEITLDQVSEKEEGGYIIEGEVSEGPSKRRKRSAKLISSARRHFRSASPDGRLHCAACGVTFDGLFEREIIQIHHKQRISEIKVVTKKGLEDALSMVVPLCPTCHAVVHTRTPPMPVEEAADALSHRGELVLDS